MNEDVIGIAKQYDERIILIDESPILCVWMMSMGITAFQAECLLATCYGEHLKIVLSGGDADTEMRQWQGYLVLEVCHILTQWKDVFSVFCAL